MAYFNRADDMVIDHGPVDDDHRQLVDLVNELHTATTEGRGQDIVEDVMQRLIRYTMEHLEREEQLMARLHFPGLERHKIGHQHFANQLRTLETKYHAGSISVASKLSTVLRDWLSLHIRRSDKEIKVFLNRQSARSGDCKVPPRFQ